MDGGVTAAHFAFLLNNSAADVLTHSQNWRRHMRKNLGSGEIVEVNEEEEVDYVICYCLCQVFLAFEKECKKFQVS